MPAVRFWTCSGRPVAPSAAGVEGISRFPCEEVPPMLRVFDCAGSVHDSPMTSRTVLASAYDNGVGAPVVLFSQLDGWPVTPVNASPAALRPPAHDSGPGWLARPFLYDSCIRNSSPVARRFLSVHFSALFPPFHGKRWESLAAPLAASVDGPGSGPLRDNGTRAFYDPRLLRHSTWWVPAARSLPSFRVFWRCRTLEIHASGHFSRPGCPQIGLFDTVGDVPRALKPFLFGCAHVAVSLD
jgi:hypothetical protein